MAAAPMAPWDYSSSSACGSGSSAYTRKLTASPPDGAMRRGRSATQRPGQLLPRIDNAVLDQPRARVAGILFEPRGDTAEAKTVAPGVHVGVDLLTRDAW